MCSFVCLSICQIRFSIKPENLRIVDTNNRRKVLVFLFSYEVGRERWDFFFSGTREKGGGRGERENEERGKRQKSRKKEKRI